MKKTENVYVGIAGVNQPLTAQQVLALAKVRADFVKEMEMYIAKFGHEQGLKYLVNGVSIADAIEAELDVGTKRLNAVMNTINKNKRI